MPYFILFAPLLKLRRKHIVWTLHDVELRSSNQGVRGKLELFLLRILSQPVQFSKYADSIIVHGSSLKEILISKRIDPSKIFVVPHFDYLYLMKYHIDKEELNNCALIFGKIKPYKGIDFLIESAKIAREKIGKEFRLVIAGKGNTNYFERALIDHALSMNVEIRNEFIPIAEIPKLLNRAKFLVLPYKDASQSGVIPLAYTFSKPVIVSNVGSIAEYVEHGKTGFIFQAGNKAELVNYILELYNDDEKCVVMGKNAHQKLLQDMSLERCSDLIRKIYDRHN
jgi:glycosyltransferase involved in cell wall biosynthesis